MKKTKLPEPTEHQLQTMIINWLKYHGWHTTRINSGMVENKYGGRIRLGEVGTPDIQAFKPNPEEPNSTYILYVEVKRPGKFATDLQNAKMDELERYGAKCLVASSIEEVETFIEVENL